MAYDYPHTIENGAGERLVFTGRRTDEKGEVIEAENFVAPGAGPPMHVHYRQEESITVISGELSWERSDGSTGKAGPGETVTFGPGDAHRFWNSGSEELHGTGYIRPPGNIEYFLTSLFDSMKRHGGKRPGVFDVAFLETRYRGEFEALIIPPPVKKVLFPILYAIGRATGRFKRYADAPESPRRAS